MKKTLTTIASVFVFITASFAFAESNNPYRVVVLDENGAPSQLVITYQTCEYTSNNIRCGTEKTTEIGSGDHREFLVSLSSEGRVGRFDILKVVDKKSGLQTHYPAQNCSGNGSNNTALISLKAMPHINAIRCVASAGK